MCLYINNKKSTVKENTQSFIKRKLERGKVVAYKIMELDRRSCYHSPYMGHGWKIGLNSSNRLSENLKAREVKNGQIDLGFHFFCNIRDAKEKAIIIKKEENYNHPRSGNKYVVFKFYLDPQYIVALGYFQRMPSLVATQAIFRKSNLVK